jgi:hypothetical protein
MDTKAKKHINWEKLAVRLFAAAVLHEMIKEKKPFGFAAFEVAQRAFRFRDDIELLAGPEQYDWISEPWKLNAWLEEKNNFRRDFERAAGEYMRCMMLSDCKTDLHTLRQALERAGWSPAEIQKIIQRKTSKIK